MAEKSASSSIQKRTASATVLACTHPSTDRCEWNKSSFSIIASWATREENLLGSARAVTMDRIHTDTDGRNSRSTVSEDAEIDNGEMGTYIIGR